MKALKPGQLVQIAHMTVTKNNIKIKHFQAWDPKSKFIHEGVCSNATSSSAAKFLEEFIQKAPFKVESIQVDGGSEFMKDFEQACAELNISLYVLPPIRPKYNGGVERGNRIFTEELYAGKHLLANPLKEVRNDLDKALNKYNSYRPHFILKGLTPLEYIHDSFLEAD